MTIGLALLSLLHFPTPDGTAGAIGLIDPVRFGGLDGGSDAFCSALSNQDDLVGDQRPLESEPELVDATRRGGGDLAGGDLIGVNVGDCKGGDCGGDIGEGDRSGGVGKGRCSIGGIL